MERQEFKRLDVMFHEPKILSIRDLAKIMAVINNLYNYYLFLTSDKFQKQVISRIKTSKAKDKLHFLYSSSMEIIFGKSNRIRVKNISHHSPLLISLEGVGPAIDSIRHLFEMFTPIYWAMKKLERDKLKVDVKKIEQELKKGDFDLTKDMIGFLLEVVGKVQGLPLGDDEKGYILKSISRNIHGIERSPIKPLMEKLESGRFKDAPE
jgi:hypothetical protein